MSFRLRQILSLFIAVALLFAPLQGVVSDVAATGGKHDMSGLSMSQPMDHMAMAEKADADHPMAGSMAMQDCEQCKADTCCLGGQCLSGHCSICVLGLLPVVAPVLSVADRSLARPADFPHSSLLSEALFRPPRA